MGKHLSCRDQIPNFRLADIWPAWLTNIFVSQSSQSGFKITPLCCWYSSSFSRCLLKYPQTFLQFRSNHQPCFQISSLLFNSLRHLANLTWKYLANLTRRYLACLTCKYPPWLAGVFPQGFQTTALLLSSDPVFLQHAIPCLSTPQPTPPPPSIL